MTKSKNKEFDRAIVLSQLSKIGGKLELYSEGADHADFEDCQELLKSCIELAWEAIGIAEKLLDERYK